MAKTTLKIMRNGEFYRLTLHEEPSYEAVAGTIAAVWPELLTEVAEDDAAAIALGSLQGQAKYRDEDGDLCTLTPHTFDDFLMTHVADARVLKLEIQPEAVQLLAAPPGRAGPPLGLSEAAAPAGGAEPPPGLAEEAAPSDWCASSGRKRCYGPKMTLQVMMALQRHGMLTHAMLTSLAVQGLPAMTQRVARKVDKINFMVKDGLGLAARGLVEALAVAAAASPGLESLAAELQEALAQQPGPSGLGQTLLKFLKAVGCLPFDAKVGLVGNVSEKLVPLLEGMAAEVGLDRCEWSIGMPALQHAGVTCDACGMSPLQGPRFKCEVCPNYDLCGNCFPQKQDLHRDCQGAVQEFQCILKGKGKGKGLHEAWARARAESWWKGLGKGKEAIRAVLAAQHAIADGSWLCAGTEPWAGAPGPWGRAWAAPTCTQVDAAAMVAAGEGGWEPCAPGHEHWWFKGKGKVKGKGKGKGWWGHGWSAEQLEGGQ
mmetsp:Transcript_100834/g.310927  ORF Transcript_100834/g.310927 Transcript_100834/m.310927 type:complete len:485 (+) Transcript_100834:96-1550(+)